jgi:hypothetical protein
MAIDPLFRASSYEPVEKILDELISRFAAAGLNVKSSRIAAYRNSIRTAREKASKGFWPENFALPDEQLWNDVHETYCLSEACKGFPNLSEPDVKSRLEKIIEGTPNLADEKKTVPRDTLFELIMASWMRLGGLNVSLRTTEDVWFEIQRIPCILECKRIQSATRLRERLDKASEQLKRQLRAPRNVALRGFIAIDISKPLLRPDGILRANDMKSAGDLLSQRLYEFYERNLKDLISPDHQRIITVFLFGGAAAVFADNGFASLFGGPGVALANHKHYGKNRRVAHRFRDAINKRP